MRGLEKLWGLAIREVEGAEDNVLLVIAGEDGNDALTALWNDEGNSDNLVDVWRKSQLSRELERLLSNIEPSMENGKRKRTESELQFGKRAVLGFDSTKAESYGSAG